MDWDQDPFAWPDLPIDEVFEIKDHFKFWHAIVGPLFLKLERSETDSWSHFNPSERALVIIWELKGGVDNSGFGAYYASYSPLRAAEAVTGLELIGAVKTADIVRRANSVFPRGNPSTDMDARFRQIEELPATTKSFWSSLDSEFYEDPDDLEATVFKYCHEHRSLFGAE